MCYRRKMSRDEMIGKEIRKPPEKLVFKIRVPVRQAIRRPEGFVVVRHAVRKSTTRSTNHEFGWSFLDLDPVASKWLTVTDDVRGDFAEFKYGTGAMHGGLVCQHLYGDDGEVSVFVSNPAEKTVLTRLPNPPFCSTGRKSSIVMNMVCTDTVGQRYKIFLMPSGEDGVPLGAGNPLLVVYDSRTRAWRTSIDPEFDLVSEWPGCNLADYTSTVCFGVEHSVMLDEMLYALVTPIAVSFEHYWLWRYNHAEDVWENTLSIDGPLAYPRLIVADNRLFIGAFARPSTPQYSVLEFLALEWDYVISEVLLDQLTRREVRRFKGPRGVQKLFNSRALKDDSLNSLEAYGIGKLIIVLCKLSGISIAYDVTTSELEYLPKMSLIPSINRKPGCDLTMWCGNAMNLRIPVAT